MMMDNFPLFLLRTGMFLFKQPVLNTKGIEALLLLSVACLTNLKRVLIF